MIREDPGKSIHSHTDYTMLQQHTAIDNDQTGVISDLSQSHT